MTRSRLSGKIGAGLDPCAAMQASVRPGARGRASGGLHAGRRRQCGGGPASGRPLPRRRRPPTRRSEGVWQYWKHTLGAVNVETPDASLNVLANGWLLYQTLSCRLWARSGYYQSRRRLRLPRSVAGRDGADPLPSRACCANICCSARRASSAKATYSTGGTRPKAAGCAPTVRTTISGCRWRCAAT